MNVGALRNKGVTLHMLVIVFQFTKGCCVTVYCRFTLKESQSQMLPLYISFVPQKETLNELQKTVRSRCGLHSSSHIKSFLLTLCQLYRTVYLNFVTRIDRPLMEKLAQELVASNSVSMVAKIFDQYLDVISLEQNLFTLNIKDSFSLYNEASLSEAHIRSVAEALVAHN